MRRHKRGWWGTIAEDVAPWTVTTVPAFHAPIRAWIGQVKSWWGWHGLKLHGREADNIAAGAEVHFILGVELDVSIGNQGGIQVQN